MEEIDSKALEGLVRKALAEIVAESGE